MLDNQDVAVLTRLNELAERHGLKPYDFIATFRHVEDKSGDVTYKLTFESTPHGNSLREERFETMLKGLGIDQNNTLELKGETCMIIDALDDALQIAPRSRLSK